MKLRHLINTRNGPFCRQPLFLFAGYLTSEQGALNKRFLLALSLLVIAIMAGVISVHNRSSSPPSRPGHEPVMFQAEKDLVTQNRQYTASIDIDRPGDDKNKQLVKALQEAFKVERVHPSGDPQRIKQDKIRKDYFRVTGIIKKLQKRGLKGEELYTAVEQELANNNYGIEALKLLESSRQFEEEMARQNLRDMGPEERFDYRYDARRRAFGEEDADLLFYQDEAHARYMLEEMAVRRDHTLSKEEADNQIQKMRQTLKVDLASRGTYISFPDERESLLEQKLRAEYGDRLDTMTEEERLAAALKSYEEELPPELVNKLKALKKLWSGKKSDDSSSE